MDGLALLEKEQNEKYLKKLCADLGLIEITYISHQIRKFILLPNC